MKHLKLLMLAIATLVVAGCAFASERGGVYSNSDGTTDGSIQGEMNDALYHYRESMGVRKLEHSTLLTKVATKYACRMAANKFLGDIQPNGDGPFERIDAAGVTYNIVGENVLYAPEANYNGTPGKNSLELWKKSPYQNSNMLQDSWNEVGYGYCSGYRVQLFVVNDYIKKMIDTPFTCPYDIEKNNSYTMMKENRPRCYPDLSRDISTRTTTTTTAAVNTVVKPVTKVLMVGNVTEAKFLANLNRIYGKKLNGKKLYLK